MNRLGVREVDEAYPPRGIVCFINVPKESFIFFNIKSKGKKLKYIKLKF